MANRERYNADTSEEYMITFLFVCVQALICIFGIFIFSPILLSMNGHSDYDTIDGRIAGNRHPYPDFFKLS